MDYRHHPTDVLIGSLLGCVCAWAAYRQYFPPLSHVWEKGRAYPMRTWGVPIKRPDDYFGSAYTSGRAGANDAAPRHGPPEELPFYNYPERRQEEYQMSGLEPMRNPVRRDLPSPGLETVTADHDTDYEVVRAKAQAGAPTQAVSRSSTGGTNVFREQVNKNQNQRRPGESYNDEEDLGSGNRGLLFESSRR